VTDDEALRDLLGSFRSSAWRLEALAQYTVPAEEATLGAFLHGATQRPHRASFASFVDLLRSLPESGRTMDRVHAITGPLTPYLRYEIEWSYVAAVEAGENIRILHSPSWVESPFGEQPPDFWLVDDAPPTRRGGLGGVTASRPTPSRRPRTEWSATLVAGPVADRGAAHPSSHRAVSPQPGLRGPGHACVRATNDRCWRDQRRHITGGWPHACSEVEAGQGDRRPREARGAGGQAGGAPSTQGGAPGRPASASDISLSDDPGE
jgi:hypothetical protein